MIVFILIVLSSSKKYPFDCYTLPNQFIHLITYLISISNLTIYKSSMFEDKNQQEEHDKGNEYQPQFIETTALLFFTGLNRCESTETRCLLPYVTDSIALSMLESILSRRLPCSITKFWKSLQIALREQIDCTILVISSLRYFTKFFSITQNYYYDNHEAPQISKVGMSGRIVLLQLFSYRQRCSSDCCCPRRRLACSRMLQAIDTSMLVNAEYDQFYFACQWTRYQYQNWPFVPCPQVYVHIWLISKSQIVYTSSFFNKTLHYSIVFLFMHCCHFFQFFFPYFLLFMLNKVRKESTSFSKMQNSLQCIIHKGSSSPVISISLGFVSPEDNNDDFMASSSSTEYRGKYLLCAGHASKTLIAQSLPFNGRFDTPLEMNKITQPTPQNAFAFPFLLTHVKYYRAHIIIIKLMTDSISLVDWLSKIGITRELNNSDILGGITVNATLTKVVPNYNVRLSATNTAANRVNNWNTIIAQLDKLGINVTQQDKGKIIGGDDKCVYSILHYLKEYADRSREEVEVNLSKIDTRGDPRSARSLLELFILVIVKYFDFSVKQAVALLSNDSKYLAHILAKGFKDDYRPVAAMLEEFLHLLPQVNTFCKNKENQIFFLKSIKPGLISKYLIVSEASLSLLTEFTKNNEGKYEIVKNELMATMILCLRRHGVQLALVIKSLTQILGYNKNMLILFMTNGSFSETILLMMEILRLAEEEGQVHEIYQLFKLQQFMQTCIENIKNSELFINAASFLLKIAESNYPYFSNNNDNISKMVDNFSSLSLSRRSDIIIHSNLLFAFLQLLAKKKNALAPQFLRVAVERYRNSLNEDESQNYLLNFIQMIDIFPSIPCSSIVEAILGRYQATTTLIGQLQLSIMQISVGSIDQKLALKLYNLLTKIFVEQLGYSFHISNIIEAIITKFQSTKIIFDLTVKFVKVSLAVYYANLRKLNYMKSLIDGTIKLDSTNVFYKIKNHQIQDILANIISLRNQQLNKAMEPLICYSFIEAEAKNKDQARGIKRIMLLLGDQADLRKLYESDAKMLVEQSKNQNKTKTDPKDKRIDSKEKIQRNDLFRYKEVDAKNRVSSDASLLVKKRDLLLNLSNPSKISSDVQKGLQKYTKAYLERMAKLSLQQQKKIADQQRKQELRRKFTLKILQKGIKINKESSVNCIYEFNSKEKEQQQDTATDFSYLPFYHPDHQQERDVKALEYLIKKYAKILKVYYNNYGGKLRPNTIRLFDDISEKANLMQTANITKLLRDHELDQYITGRQVQYIVQKINALLKKQYKDSSVLDYEVFQNFIIQAALIMFSRPPKDMRSHPISDMFQLIIDKFRQHAQEHKIDEKIFDSNESIQTAKPQQLKEINQKLLDNPDYILPEGYKKLTVKTVIFDHLFRLEALDQTYKNVYEALDQILFDKLGFHIIEPYSTTTVQVTARPLLYQTQISSSDQSMKQRSLSSVFPKGRETRKQGEESGQLGEEQTNRERLQNQFLRQKKLKQQQKQRRQEEEEKRREQRNKELKSLLQMHRTKQQQIEQQKQQDKKKETARQEDQKRKKEKYQQTLKKKVEEYMEKKKEEKMKEEETQKKKREEDSKNFQKLKQDIERKKKIVDDSKIKKKQQEDYKFQKENEQKKKLEEYKKNKLIEKKEKNKKLLEEYKEKKVKDKSGKSQPISQQPQSPKEELAEPIKRQNSHKSASKANSKHLE